MSLIPQQRARKPVFAYVIDDEREVRISTGVLLQSGGIAVVPFAGANDFLDALAHLEPGCVVLDIGMPVKDGLMLLSEMRSRGCRWPAIVMTGRGDIPLAVKAMKLGAIEFLEKPFDDSSLFASLHLGFSILDATIGEDEERNAASAKVSKLTRRERDVLEGIVRGASNQEIAAYLNIGRRTVEMHRATMMDKIGAKRVSDVVTIALAAGLEPIER